MFDIIQNKGYILINHTISILVRLRMSSTVPNTIKVS